MQQLQLLLGYLLLFQFLLFFFFFSLFPFLSLRGITSNYITYQGCGLCFRFSSTSSPFSFFYRGRLTCSVMIVLDILHDRVKLETPKFCTFANLSSEVLHFTARLDSVPHITLICKE
ncbi:Uncharacterized protein TCM_034826 isoform 1 [Theobroma cacao]|uniref:Uncharacterized protein isoform 1 n=1 Tax=Theobroma cacao TaxID=3641 RepID=A0A061FEZ8_THECC|nr:Uncharacterized protein TCM_034826 isoform 1 [Theobroma cacao]EOY15905.1 Uncharacterized protein TCM_034826 isoform 1 [Theobroma cacao]